MRKTLFIFSVTVLLFLSLTTNFCCKEKTEQKTTISKLTIELQPLQNISSADVDYVYNKLKEVYPNIIVNKQINIPSFCFYKPRNRYRADSIIHYLSTLAEKDHVIIGLTNKDISTTKNEIKDYGIMGLGFRPGNACVASTFRLSKTNSQQQFFKIAIHELGHTQGLPHCAETTCFMRDAEGGNPTNDEVAFCSKCKILLSKKGWQL